MLFFSKKTFTTDNGLPHNFVKHISQDSTGFLWISTWDGLSRYDGYEFRNYYHKPNDSTTFPFFIVNKTLVDKLNNVWVFCPQNELVIYNRAKDNFDRFTPDGKNGFAASDITSDANGNVWLLNHWKRRLYCWNPDTRKLQGFRMIGNKPQSASWDNIIPSIVFDNRGNVWHFYFSANKYCISKGAVENDSTISFQEFEPLHLQLFDPLNENRTPRVFDVFVSEKGETCLFTTFGIYSLSAASNNFKKTTEPSKSSRLKGKPFFYWSDQETGISLLETQSGEIHRVKTDQNNYVACIFMDRENNLWSGESAESLDNIGLKRYIKTPDRFKHYFTKKNEHGNKHLVFPILKDRFGDTWVGTRGLDYVFRIKPNGEVLKIKYLERFKGPERPTVRSISEDSLGVWMGCTNNHLLYYSFANQGFTSFIDLNKIGNNTDIVLHNVLSDNGGVVINGRYSVYRFDGLTGSLQLKYKGRDIEPKFCMVEDGENGYWLGSRANQVIHLDAEFNELKKYQIGNGGVLVEHLCVGDSNDVWVALMGGGLGRLFPETGKYEVFTSADGLANNTTYSILKDKTGNLWISTNKGISRFNPKTKHFRNFAKAEGLLIEEFNSDAFSQAPDGEMFFGGVGGMVSFYPDSVEQSGGGQSHGKLLITGFKVSGGPRYFKKPVYQSNTLMLSKGDNNFQLTFADINFQNAEKIKYRYRLRGKNNAWIAADYRHRHLNYANLSPGNFIIEIQSGKLNGGWNAPTSLVVIIPPYYYQTLWFKLLVLLFAALIVAGNFFMYNRQIRLRAKQKNDIMKLESLRGQMNPHFISNSLNSINYFISNNDKISANHYIADFSRLIRSFLNNLSADYVAFDKELETLEDYLKLEHLRFSDKFDYSIITNGIEKQENTKIFPGMVQPFIENAIWHGVRALENHKGSIKIEFIPINSKKIKCTIQDDGIGRKQARLLGNKLPRTESRGIGIVLERLRIISKILRINYNVKIEDLHPDKQDTGTLVMIDLPVKTPGTND